MSGRALKKVVSISIEMRPLLESEIPVIPRRLDPNRSAARQREWFQKSTRGELICPAGRLGGVPVGHAMTIRYGINIDVVSSRFDSCPNIEDLYLTPERRSQVSHTETLTMERGIKLLGLAVGIGNLRAAALHKRLGYMDTGLGEFGADIRYNDAEGRLRSGGERCGCLIRPLGDYEPH